MIARGTDAEVSVIALVGERGREVREFLEDDLGPEGLARSIVVVSTSDEPALMRLRAAFVATRIAESFRDRGADVMLMMDSLTRVAMAQREIGLSVGEPPATRGYPPSTFSLLAQLLERAGTGEVGSVTGIYTVLVDGDDHNEPIADSATSFSTANSLFPVISRPWMRCDRSLALLRGSIVRNTRLPQVTYARCWPLGRPHRTCSMSVRINRARIRSSMRPSITPPPSMHSCNSAWTTRPPPSRPGTGSRRSPDY
jgi:hypothetical protein